MFLFIRTISIRGIRASAIQGIMKRIKAKGIEVVIYKRQEHWTIVQGIANIEIDDDIIRLVQRGCHD